MKMKPNYPIYIPSKGRWENCLTAEMLKKEGLDFKISVEDNEYDNYAKVYGEERLLKLPGHDFGNVSYSRNFIKDYSREQGEEKHWHFDDDIRYMYEFNGKDLERKPTSEVLFKAEQFVDRYKNIGIAGLSSDVFVRFQKKPFDLNRLCYTAMLIDNNTEARWDMDTVDDVDYNLQILDSGLCTLRFYAFAFKWYASTKQKGGLTEMHLDPKRKKIVENTVIKWQLESMKEKITNGNKVFLLKYNKKFRSYNNMLISKDE
jgi:hypothetical protein